MDTTVNHALATLHKCIVVDESAILVVVLRSNVQLAQTVEIM